MPTDVELELRDLAARSGAPTAATPGLDGLEREAQGEPRSRGADPVQEAFRSIQTAVASFSFGGGSKRAPATPDSEAVTSEQAAAYGGSELLNAFRGQDQLNSETFSQRVRLASLLDPEHLDQLQTYRDKLDVYDRQLFDEGFFPRFGEAVTTEVQRQMDVARGGSGISMSAYERKPTFYTKGNVTIPYREGQPAPVGATAHFYD